MQFKKKRVFSAATFKEFVKSNKWDKSPNFWIANKTNEFSYSRLGILIGRKAGIAVRRNWIKRKIREMFRRSVFSANIDVLVWVRYSVVKATKHELSDQISNIFKPLTKFLK